MMMRKEAGFTLSGVMAGVLVASLGMAIVLPNLHRWYRKAKLDGALNTVSVMVHDARMRALKEKTSYRLIFHDENDSSPNTVEMQNNSSGSFQPTGAETLPYGIRLLGSGTTNSMNSMTVTSRGACTSGSVFLRNSSSDLTKVVIRPACQTYND